jgi:hypothetical protein
VSHTKSEDREQVVEFSLVEVVAKPIRMVLGSTEQERSGCRREIQIQGRGTHTRICCKEARQ